MINEIGFALLIVVVLVAAFQGVTVLLAKRSRGRAVAELGPDALALVGDRDELLVYFHSPTCAPCRMMTPAVDAVAAAHPGRVVTVDVGENPRAAAAFSVRATPTLVHVRGGKIDNVYLGGKGRSFIEGLIA